MAQLGRLTSPTGLAARPNVFGLESGSTSPPRRRKRQGQLEQWQKVGEVRKIGRALRWSLAIFHPIESECEHFYEQFLCRHKTY